MDIPAYVEDLFNKSIFTSAEKLMAATPDQINEDPAIPLYSAIMAPIMAHFQKGSLIDAMAYEKGLKNFAAALMEWQKGQAMYPDANSTMRLTYGHVLPYSPKDALKYEYFTTAKGLLEKENPNDPEFILPAGIKELRLLLFYGSIDLCDLLICIFFQDRSDVFPQFGKNRFLPGPGIVYCGNYRCLQDFFFDCSCRAVNAAAFL